MTTCPCCGHPLGNRGFAPRNGTAPCAADRADGWDLDWSVQVAVLDVPGLVDVRPVSSVLGFVRARWS